MTRPILLTEAEAAERMRICARTLRKARQDGLLHYVLIGRAVRYTIDDLESFVAASRKVQMPCLPQIPHTGARPTRKRRLTTAEVLPFRDQRRGR